MRLVLGAILLVLACLGTVAQAQEVALAGRSCVGGADNQSVALALDPAGLDCGPTRFVTAARFVRTHSDLRLANLPPSRNLVWQSDPSAFDSLLLRVLWSDGSDSWIDVDPQMAARNWTAGGWFSVPLPRASGDARILAVDAVFERPRMPASARVVRIVSAQRAAQTHFARAVFDALMLGMLIVPVVYTLMFYRALKAPFMLWHVAMSLAAALFAVTNTGLLFLLFPDFPLFWRWQANSLLLLLSLMCALFFTFGMLEKGKLSPRWRMAMLLSAVPPIVLKIVMLLDAEPTRPFNGLLAPSYLPMIAVCLAGLGSAVARGSRAATFALISFSAIALVGLVVMLDNALQLHLPVLADDLMLLSLVVMTIAGAAAVGDKFILLRVRLERERGRAAWLGTLAHTDELTGLANRRAFDARETLEDWEALVVADLDRFKLVNDTDGHAAGDRALRNAAETFQAAVEGIPGSAVYRLGGEEFGIVVPYEDEASLRARCEVFRQAIARAEIARVAGIPLTASLGAVPGEGQPIAEAFMTADRAMYRAKQMGRNCVRLACDLEESELPIDENLAISRL